MGTFLRELFTLMHPHYFVNFVLSTIFFLTKTIRPFCYFLYEDCELELVSTGRSRLNLDLLPRVHLIFQLVKWSSGILDDIYSRNNLCICASPIMIKVSGYVEYSWHILLVAFFSAARAVFCTSRCPFAHLGRTPLQWRAWDLVIAMCRKECNQECNQCTCVAASQPFSSALPTHKHCSSADRLYWACTHCFRPLNTWVHMHQMQMVAPRADIWIWP